MIIGIPHSTAQLKSADTPVHTTKTPATEYYALKMSLCIYHNFKNISRIFIAGRVPYQQLQQIPF
jgi:hypothetical protein